MLQHFALEEDSLFPAFEAATGSQIGPTMVMRNEHSQMRALMQDMAQLLSSEQAGDYLGCADTLLILMQQHNMKEENILYPMCNQHITGFADLVAAGAAETEPGVVCYHEDNFFGYTAATSFRFGE